MKRAALVIVFGLIYADVASAASLKNTCEKRRAQYRNSCKAQSDVSKVEGMPASVFANSFENCRRRDFVTVSLINVPASGDTPAHLKCTIAEDSNKAGQSRKEVISSLGTSLIVELDESNLTTQVHTKDGHISCKADPKETNPMNWWCGVMIKPSTKYTDVPPLDNYQLSPLFYRQIKLSDFLMPKQTAEGSVAGDSAEIIN